MTIKCPDDHWLTLIIDDFGLWDPGVVAEPDHPAAEGSLRRDRCVRRDSSASGWRVVALEEAGGCHIPVFLVFQGKTRKTTGFDLIRLISPGLGWRESGEIGSYP